MHIGVVLNYIIKTASALL